MMSRTPLILALGVVMSVVVACAPAAPPVPTAAPAKPAPTTAPAKPAAPPAAKPAEKAAEKPATQPGASPAAKPAAKADAGGAAALQALITQAKQERSVSILVGTDVGPDGGALLANAFKARFGLTNLEVKPDGAGSESAKHREALTETKSGAPASYDALEGASADAVVLFTQGATQPIDNWQAVLAEINSQVKDGKVKPEQISPAPFSGSGYIWANRNVNMLVWNTTRVNNPADLPKRYIDLADPKYKDKFAISQFVNEAPYGVLAYSKEQWLDYADKMGKNAGAVIHPNQQADRLALGEFDFQPLGIEKYYRILRADPKAPVDKRFFEDFTPMNELIYTIRKGAKSPASAKLWVMWMSTPEAQETYFKATTYTNISYGNRPIDDEARKLLQQSNSKLVHWTKDAPSTEMLKWFGTTEGSAYLDTVEKALTQRK